MARFAEFFLSKFENLIRTLNVKQEMTLCKKNSVIFGCKQKIDSKKIVLNEPPTDNSHKCINFLKKYFFYHVIPLHCINKKQKSIHHNSQI